MNTLISPKSSNTYNKKRRVSGRGLKSARISKKPSNKLREDNFSSEERVVEEVPNEMDPFRYEQLQKAKKKKEIEDKALKSYRVEQWKGSKLTSHRGAKPKDEENNDKRSVFDRLLKDTAHRKMKKEKYSKNDKYEQREK